MRTNGGSTEDLYGNDGYGGINRPLHADQDDKGKVIKDTQLVLLSDIYNSYGGPGPAWWGWIIL